MPPIATQPTPLPISQGNTQTVGLNGLQDQNGAFLNSATLSATLYDLDGNQVPGCVNVTMNYVAASNGDYLGVFGNASFSPPLGAGYTLVITGSQSGNAVKIVKQVEVIDRSY